jgi:hypothetical protein
LTGKTDERKQPKDGGAALRKAIPGVGCGDRGNPVPSVSSLVSRGHEASTPQVTAARGSVQPGGTTFGLGPLTGGVRW